MEKLDSEYPTEEQMRELFEARKKPGAIAEILRKWEQKEADKAESGCRDQSDSAVTPPAVSCLPSFVDTLA
ncbi:MAG: hypothetical protein ACYDC6_14495 [Acidobacteriaceae bacterium]